MSDPTREALDDPRTECTHNDERGSTVMQVRDDRYECAVCGESFRLVPFSGPLAASPTAPGLDEAWDELRDELASLAYDLTRSPNGPAEFRGEIGVVIARHRDTIEEARLSEVQSDDR